MQPMSAGGDGCRQPRSHRLTAPLRYFGSSYRCAICRPRAFLTGDGGNRDQRSLRLWLVPQTQGSAAAEASGADRRNRVSGGRVPRPARTVPLPAPGDRSSPSAASAGRRPDVDQVRTALIKPGHAFHATLHRLRGDLQPRGSKQIAQEVKAPADPSDEGLVGVLLELEFRQGFRSPGQDRGEQRPAGTGDHDLAAARTSPNQGPVRRDLSAGLSVARRAFQADESDGESRLLKTGRHRACGFCTAAGSTAAAIAFGSALPLRNSLTRRDCSSGPLMRSEYLT